MDRRFLLRRSGAVLCTSMILLALGACGADQPEPGQAQRGPRKMNPLALAVEVQGEALLGLQLPAPSGLPVTLRAASTDDAQLLLGSEFGEDLPRSRVTADGDALDFFPAFSAGSSLGDAAYAIYQFESLTEDILLQKLTLQWATQPGQDWFVGLANFASNRWEWFRAAELQGTGVPNSLVFVAFSPDQHIDAVNERALVAVVALGSDVLRLESLHFNNFNPELESIDVPDTGFAGIELNMVAVAKDLDDSVVFYRWDFGDGEVSPISQTGAITHTYSASGEYDVVLTMADGSGGESTVAPTEKISITTEGNLAPQVQLSANGSDLGAGGIRPLSVDLQAVASDSDGSVASFEWDLDDDGVFEIDGGATPSLDALFTRHGVFDVTVKVKDDDGDFSTDSVQIDTTQGDWHVQVATQSADRVLSSPWMAIVAGRPALVFSDQPTDFTDSDIRYVRAGTTDGTGLWDGTQLLEADPAGLLFSPRMLIANGRPAAAFMSGGGELRYERSEDTTGSLWGAGQAVIASGSLTNFDIDLVLGQPAASFQRFDTGDLHYRRASDVDGTAWGTERTVDNSSADIVGSGSSLEVINGLPAVSYRDQSNARLVYKRALDSLGDGWGNVQVLGDTGNSGTVSHLIEVAGRPAVAFDSSFSAAFKRADDSAGDAWPDNDLILDLAFTNSAPFGICLYQNLPCVVYPALSLQEIRFVLAKDSEGSAWEAFEAVTALPNSFPPTGHMLIVDGQPAIAWATSSSDTINYAVYF